MSRRSKIVGGLLVVAVAGGGATAYAFSRSDRSTTAAATTTTPAAQPAAAAKTAKVVRTDLVLTQDVAGTVTYGNLSVIKAAAGTASTNIITGLPAVGTVIEFGRPLYEVNGVPGPILMKGDRPMWRALSSGVAVGSDVQLLEQNLADLGFGDSTLVIDTTYNYTTVTAVKRLQAINGQTVTGTIALGAVVFSPNPLRVASVKAVPGDAESGEILSVTGTARTVHVALDASKAALAHTGDAVSVTLPDTTTTPATITSVGTTVTVATSGSGQNAATTSTIDVTVALPDTVDIPDQAPVTVKLTTSKATGVLAVPVTSLIALAEGGYAVDVMRNGATTLVGVTIGQFSDTLVEVTGDLHEGDDVVTA